MIDALEKIERELMASAHRRARKRRRQVSRRAVVAAGAACLAAATAASAITGVGPIPSGGSRPTPQPSPLTPKAQGERTDLEVQGPNGRSWTMRALRGEEGSLCVEAPPRPSPDTSGVCAGYDALARDFDRFGLVLNVGGPEDGSSSDHVHFLMGLARADAASIRVIDQTGRELTPRLSEVWATARPGDGSPPAGAVAPQATSGEPIRTRAFMLAADGPYPTEGGGVKIEVTLADGRVLESSWPSDYTPQ